jgi:hypothetical protein
MDVSNSNVANKIQIGILFDSSIAKNSLKIGV